MNNQTRVEFKLVLTTRCHLYPQVSHVLAFASMYCKCQQLAEHKKACSFATIFFGTINQKVYQLALVSKLMMMIFLYLLIFEIEEIAKFHD